MARETTSKNMDGITDLVVIAPIKPGFIEAYENVTYATRLKIVAEALNRVRVAAREHEMITPFSDVTERILTLLDFRIGVIDKDLFALEVQGGASGAEDAARSLESRRYLYLTATFDGAWEPYMRLIWDPLGPFLDLLFCNCENYVTASEHTFEEYAQWVRDNQVNSAIFYAATGLGVRDHLYLNRLDQVLRARPASQCDLEIAGMTMPNPELAAGAERLLAASDPAQAGKIHELALEALTVLYRLADYFPPEWMTGSGTSEGQYLMRAAESLLAGWERMIPQEPLPPAWKAVERIYAEPLGWYRSGVRHLRELEATRTAERPKDPAFDRSEVQGGILKPQGSLEEPMLQGALLLMTIVDTDSARGLLARLEADNEIHFQEGQGATRADGFFRTIALSADGLRRLGLKQDALDWFPKEFREGMEMRSGLVGDMRENHPRRWLLPERNWPPLAPDADPVAKARPPIDSSEIDIVLQIRTASADRQAMMSEIARLAESAGVTLQGYELMCANYDPAGLLVDYFGFHDGVSQPRPESDLPEAPVPDAAEPAYRDEVRVGEILLGYRNDRDDFRPIDFASPAEPSWRRKNRKEALDYLFNGTFLVIRKLEQKVAAFDALIATETVRINKDHPGLPTPMTEDRLKARMLGRYPDGTPLIQTADGTRNNFNFKDDPHGVGCPHAAHIRRTNPREPFQGRNAPRIMRRGMSFDHSDGKGGAGARGLMFMAYNASIAEQFETIQRWINGGSSTFVASGHNDPLLGVAPRSGAMHKVERVFRFIEGNEVIRVTMSDPFVALHWGLYLFVPSRTALRKLHALTEPYQPFRERLETHGRAVIGRLKTISNTQTKTGEWKRLLEDFDAKDPSEGDITPDVWSAIRWYYGGSFKIPPGNRITPNWNAAPDETRQPIVLAASRKHVMTVLSDWELFSTEEQLRRLEPRPEPSGDGTPLPPDPVGIPIFVAQQPDNRYRAQYLNGRFNYRLESEVTNEILLSYDDESGFQAGYSAGKLILAAAKGAADQSGRKYFKLELRRQYLLPALGALCKIWYGVPDGETFHLGGWTWQPPETRNPPGPRCPGDFLSPSRNAFYPRPTETVKAFAEHHREAVRAGSLAFVEKHRNQPGRPDLGTVAKRMFEAFPNHPADNDVLARNLVGTMIGAIPPMDGNLRGILLEWLNERTLWRHQAALRRALGDRPASEDFSKARAVLYGPVSQAMCRRPAPDLIYRTAVSNTELECRPRGDYPDKVEINEGDLVVVSLVSAAQRSLEHHDDGEVSIVFGGNRRAAYEEGKDLDYPVHACPAQKMAMGAIMGILAALLDSGRIQALPASLIVRISDWPKAAPPPGQ